MSNLPARETVRLLSKLEHKPHLITAHWYMLEALISACMERAYSARDTRSKMTATAIEYRARLLRERVKGCQN